MTRFLCKLLLALVPLGAALPQQSPPQKKTAPANDIFSGTVTELAADSITVVRQVPAHDSVTRKFALDGQTKVEGKLRVKARVTVRYRTGEDGELQALHIIVR